MKKNQDRGNVVFFIGVIIFVIALALGYFTEISDLVIDLVMGFGLIIEFVGLCICYKKDKNEGEKVGEEVNSLEEERKNIKEEKVEDVVEVVSEMTIDEDVIDKEVTSGKTKKNTTSKVRNGGKSNKVAETNKVNKTNKTSGKKKTTTGNSTKSSTNKNKNSTKKKTTKKNTTKKNNK